MKLRHLPSLCAALLALCPTLATAQSTSAVPGFISYQGRVVDAAGANVGAGTPVNRTVIFRIWDNPSSTAAANLIYSEAQTVTVSEGEFSVLVGQGVENPTQTFSYSETTKKLADFSTAFNGSARYLGVTVAAGATIATTDNEITPRQQIVSTAFAMRAKFAESIGSSSDLTLTPLSGTASNYGLGWYGTGRLFGTAAVDGPVLYGNSGGGLGSNNGSTKTLALQWNAAGQIGVGATTFDTNNKLTLQGDDSASPARQLVIRGNTDTTKRLNIGFDTTGNQATLQSYNGASTPGPLLLNASGGNVGIGTPTPENRLTIQRTVGSNNVVINQNDLQLEIRNGIGAKSMGIGVMDDGKGVIQVKEKNNGAGYADLLLSPIAGNVGIGTSSPSHALTVGGNPGDSQAINFRSFDTKSLNWKGGGAFGGSSAAVIMGESSGIAQIGGHSPTLSAWRDLTINGGGGNVGIGTGTAAPTAKLDVAGDIKSNGKSVPVAEENLRIIRGSVTGAGVIGAGTGFTAAIDGAFVRVTFPAGTFSSIPTVVVSPWDTSVGWPQYVSSITTTSFHSTGAFSGASGASRQNFTFIAIGPR